MLLALYMAKNFLLSAYLLGWTSCPDKEGSVGTILMLSWKEREANPSNITVTLYKLVLHST